MNNDLSIDHNKWESELKVGDIIEARFTNYGHSYRFKARIIKINKKSIVVLSIEHGEHENHNPLKTFYIPTLCNRRFSINNGIFPINNRNVELSEETYRLLLRCKKEFPKKYTDDEIIKGALESYICDLHPV